MIDFILYKLANFVNSCHLLILFKFYISNVANHFSFKVLTVFLLLCIIKLTKKKGVVIFFDMINYNETQFEHHIAGQFYTDTPWIHPTTSIESYEMILVLNGVVYMQEENIEYTLNPNDFILLDADKIHGGFKQSKGITSFYWIHFRTPDISKLPPIKKVIRNLDITHLFKEYIHTHRLKAYPDAYKDIALLNLLARISEHTLFTKNQSNATVTRIYQHIRANASPSLSTRDVAKQFEYTQEHLTRLMKKHYGFGMKRINNDFLISKANNLLINTTYSLKQISDILDFGTLNDFLKFYKYHTNLSPTEYRNLYHLNNINNE